MSSAASISAAKRRRGAQTSVPPQSSNRGRPQQQQQQRPQQQQQQAVQRNRVNPMQILEDHEKRLRVIEGGSESSSTANNDVQNKDIQEEKDSKFAILERENIELHKKIEIMKNKIIEMNEDIIDLKKLKDIVFTIQSSVLSNSQKVESFRVNSTVSQEVSQEVSQAVSQEVSQEIQDITADLETATLGYGEENKNHDSNLDNNDENVTSGESVNSEVVSGFE